MQDLEVNNQTGGLDGAYLSYLLLCNKQPQNLEA